MNFLPKDIVGKIALDNFESAIDLESYAQTNFKTRRDIDINQVFRKWEQKRMPNDRWRILSNQLVKNLFDHTYYAYTFSKNNQKSFEISSSTIRCYTNNQDVMRKIVFIIPDMESVKYNDVFVFNIFNKHLKKFDILFYLLFENGYSYDVKNDFKISCKMCTSTATGKCCQSGVYCDKKCQSLDIEHICK
jgi:hypothetical protein